MDTSRTRRGRKNPGSIANSEAGTSAPGAGSQAGSETGAGPGSGAAAASGADTGSGSLAAYRRTFPQHQLLWIAKRVLLAFNRALAHLSTHGSRVLYDPSAFSWTSRIEASWRVLRSELDQVMQQPERIPQFAEISVDQRHLTPPANWKSFFFLAYGFRAEENCRKCPQTARIVETIPGVQTAFFSILEPGTYIRPHHGPFGGVLRYHLALKVPEPSTGCRIRVDKQIASWEEGRSLVFDDTYEHEVWNDTDGVRVVLFVDFERPLPPPLAQINRALIRVVARSALVQDAIRRYEQWTGEQVVPR